MSSWGYAQRYNPPGLPTLCNAEQVRTIPSAPRRRQATNNPPPSLSIEVAIRESVLTALNPHANKLTIHILAAVAQHEREMIAQRTWPHRRPIR